MFVAENELGVIVSFAQQCQAKGWEISTIGSTFPDAIILRKEDGAQFRAEFEYQAVNFTAHGHDLRKCDVIICWTNDWPNCVIPIWEMRDWKDATLVTVDARDKVIAQLQIENSKLRRKVDQLSSTLETQQDVTLTKGLPKDRRQIALLRVFARNPSEDVGQVAQMFGVSARTIGRDLSELEDAGCIRSNGHGVEVLEVAQ